MKSSPKKTSKRLPSRVLKYAFISIIILVSMAACLLLTESALRIMEKFISTDFLDYGDVLRNGQVGPGGLLKENFREHVADGFGGTVLWVNNSTGFRNEKETSQDPPPGVMRILSMGDSFTAGYRVDQNDTFSFRLERHLNRTLGKTEVLVSCIENPATGLYYLTKHGFSFHPHVILLGITLGNDIAQDYVYIHPGGTYELQVDSGKFRIELRKEKPKFGFLHGLEKYDIPPDCIEEKSFFEYCLQRIEKYVDRLRLLRLFRTPTSSIKNWYGTHKYENPKIFDIIHGLGFYIAEPPPIINEAYESLFKVLLAYKQCCKDEGIVLIVAVFPQSFQVQPGIWQKTRRKFSLKESAFDLLAPNKRITAFCREHGFNFFDPVEAMKRHFEQDGKDLYLPHGDMHWNVQGHRILFEVCKDEIKKWIRPVYQSLAQ